MGYLHWMEMEGWKESMELCKRTKGFVGLEDRIAMIMAFCGERWKDGLDWRIMIAEVFYCAMNER